MSQNNNTGKRWDINDNARKLLYESVKTTNETENIANATLEQLQEQGNALDDFNENVRKYTVP